MVVVWSVYVVVLVCLAMSSFFNFHCNIKLSSALILYKYGKRVFIVNMYKT